MIIPTDVLTPNLQWVAQAGLGLFAAAFFLRFLYRILRSSPLAVLPGPPSSSWLYGSLPDIAVGEAASVDFEWNARYGDAIRLEGPLKQEYLWISDPKACQYVLQTACYDFPKHRERGMFIAFITGGGVTSSEGADHVRQRKIINPGFGISESRALLPIITRSAHNTISKWQDMLDASQTAVVDVPGWMSRTALDIVGEAAFDYQFGAVDDPDAEPSKSVRNLFVEVFGKPTRVTFLFMWMFQFVPKKMLMWMFRRSPNPKLKRLAEHEALTRKMATDLVDAKTSAFLEGKGAKDILSLLVQANASTDKENALSRAELIAQVQTITIAGHETTGSTLTFAILELCRRPEMQTRLRNEILELEARRGRDFDWRDYEGMVFLNAFLREILRFHPVMYYLYREAGRDDFVPLHKPIVGTDGKIINAVPVRKGTKVIISIAAFNRNEEIFGESPHSFDPERWIKGVVKGEGDEKVPSIGAYASALTFSGGTRNCVGWRFALLELQAIITELVRNFEFELTVDPSQIARTSSGVMSPIVKGKEDDGVHMSCKVRAIQRD